MHNEETSSSLTSLVSSNHIAWIWGLELLSWHWYCHLKTGTPIAAIRF
jgi:hypothetical protein